MVTIHLLPRWFRLSGATASTFVLPNAQASNAGSYAVVVTNAGGSITSNVVTLSVVAGVARLTNLSVRSIAGSDDQTLIVGFVIGGDSGSKQILIRGIGPALSQFGVSRRSATNAF